MTDAPAQNQVSPIDAYLAVQRRLGLDPGFVIQLRRIGMFNSMSAEEICDMVDAMSAVFGEELAEEILRNSPADYRSSIENVEPRVSRIMSLCQGLNRRDVLRMMRHSPKTFTADGETFSTLLENAAKLIPNDGRRWTFLYAFPGYFSLNPVIVSECVARGVTEATYGLDHPALWHALQTEQNAWLRLETLMRDLRYNDALRTRYHERLYKDLGSYDAGHAFVSELFISGWTADDLREALGAYDQFRAAGSKRIIAIQKALTESFGVPLARVVLAFMKRPLILQAEPDTIMERLNAAFPFPSAKDAERLLLKAPALLLQDTVVTARRRAQLIASGEKPDANPALLIVRDAARSVPIRKIMQADETSKPMASSRPDGMRHIGEHAETQPQTEPEERRNAQRSVPDIPFDVLRVREPNDRRRLAALLAEADEASAVPERKPPTHAAIALCLDGLGYEIDKRNARMRWLAAWTMSEETALDLVRKLVDAGWNAHALDALLSHRKAYAPAVVERLLELHDMLVHGFGLQKRVAAYIVSITPTFSEVPADVIRRRICAALGTTPTPRAVARLMLNAPSALRLDAEELGNRRANLEARGVRVSLSPRRIMQKAAEIPPKQLSEAAEYEPPTPVVAQLVPACKTPIQALESAGWARRDAMLHLRAFPGLKNTDPAQLCHSLIRLKADLNLSGTAFTRRLNQNTRALVYDRDALAASYLPQANGMRRTLKTASERLTPDQTAEAKRIAVGVHALDPGPKWSEPTTRQALSILRLCGFTGSTAKTFLGKYPELLTDDGRPMAVAYWLMTTYNLDPEGVCKNLRDPDSRMALFLPPETLLDTINERRKLGIKYDELHVHSSSLDPCEKWSRVFCPILEITFRLELLLEMGERPEMPLQKKLHAPSRTSFRQLVKNQREGKRRR